MKQRGNINITIYTLSVITQAKVILINIIKTTFIFFKLTFEMKVL